MLDHLERLMRVVCAEKCVGGVRVVFYNSSP
jgi:hypothetical protein